MLHEPMHLRATALGLLLAVLLLVAFFVVGKIHPTSTAAAADLMVTPAHAADAL